MINKIHSHLTGIFNPLFLAGLILITSGSLLLEIPGMLLILLDLIYDLKEIKENK